MNKTTLIEKVLDSIDGATKKDITIVVDTILDVVTNTVASGESVKISGFGTFERVERSARKGVNPKTGEKIEIAASKAPKFKASKVFTRIVNA